MAGAEHKCICSITAGKLVVAALAVDRVVAVVPGGRSVTLRTNSSAKLPLVEWARALVAFAYNDDSEDEFHLRGVASGADYVDRLFRPRQ